MKKVSILLVVALITMLGCSEREKTSEENANLETLTQSWSGAIEIPNQPLNITVKFENNEELTGLISIPIQGIQNYPLSLIDVDGKDIYFTMDIQGQSIAFDGEMGENTITGTFTQSGASFPFTLNKGDAVAEESAEEGEFLQIETEEGILYGQLETPEGEGPFPVMLIIPGSGPTDRNGNSPGMENNSLKLLAEQFAEEGVASVRYDKRGAGKNTQAVISEEDMEFDQFVNDASLWVEKLTKEEAFSKIGIIGHSQGSLVGMLAAQKENVDSFISLAGVGHSIDIVLHDQLSEQLPETLLKESENILQQLKEEKQVENVSEELQSVFRPSVQPFLSSWIQYDPAEEISKLEIPTLIINGENDLQVGIAEAETLHHAKDNSELLLLEKMNHVLKEAPKNEEGNMATYTDPELPLAEGLMEEIAGFLEDTK